MFKLKSFLFAAVVTVASLVPVATASALGAQNHSETLLLDD
jgi:hypothetical protein